MKPKLELIPGSPKLQALYEINMLAKAAELEVNVIEDTPSKLRFQLLNENDGTALGKFEHYNFLNAFLDKSEVASDENTEVIENSTAINIVITFS